MQRLAEFVALAAAAALWAALAWPLLWGEVYAFNDLSLFHLPVRAFYAACLASGESFLWWPNQFTGFYLHGEGQGGLLHPFQWLSYRFLPLDVAFQLELLRSPLAAFAGAVLLARRWQLDPAPALFGALFVAFSGFVFLHHMHLNLIGVWAHLPWLLLCIDVALRDARPARAATATAGFATLSASQLLLGHPQGVWLSLLVQVPYALLVAVRAGRARVLPALGVAVKCLEAV